MPSKKRKVKKPPPKQEQIIDPALEPYRVDRNTLRFKNIDYYPEDDCFHRMLLDVGYPKNETEIPETLQERLKQDKSVHPMENYNVFYSFNDNRIKERMIKLMNTDVVRLMDRDFMKELQDRIADVHKEELKERLKKRAEREFFREIDLVIEGVLPKEKALKNVTKIFSFWDPDLDGAAGRKLVRTPPVLKPPDVDYRPFMTKEELNPPSPGTDISPLHSDIPEDDEMEKIRKDFVYNLQDEIERMYIQPYTYEKVRYETESVKELRKAKDVETMYEMAEKIFYEI